METREQMKRLMEKIQMPEEGIAQLLEAREQLEKADDWDVIVQTAEQVMAADGELSVLTQALAETEELVVGITSNNGDHRKVRKVSAQIREVLETENYNLE